MKNIGVICEYNPFHNGHLRQLGKMRERGTAICLMSGNFVQRGEPALLDRQTRARAAVECGADLVLELPLTCALRSAEGFADGGVDIFSRMGCVDALMFGCEEVDCNKIMSTARALLDENFSAALKAELAAGVSFPVARERALEAMGTDASLLREPNNILAVEYCKALLRRDSLIEPIMLRRDGSYHLSDDPQNPSASVLRGMDDWTGFVPEAARAVFANAPRYTTAAGERAWLARLRSMTESEFEALPYGSEGLWRRVMHACRTERTLEDILTAAKSKRYPRTRLTRMLLCAFLGITEERLNAPVPYVRVLATNARGQTVLRQIKKQGSIAPVHAGETPPDRAYAELERRASDLYGLFRADTPDAPNAESRARIFRRTDV